MNRGLALQRTRSEQLTIASGSAANPTRTPVRINADWFYLYYASYSINIGFDDGPPVPIWTGTLYRQKFEKVDFINPTSRAVLVQYIAGSGEPPDFPPVEKRATQLVPYPVTSCGAGAMTVIKSVSPSYLAAWLSIPSTEPNDVMLANSSVSATNGVFLPRGYPPLRVPLLDGVAIYNPGVSAVKVYSMFEAIT